MYTINYRGMYIQGYINKKECYLSIYPEIKCKSLHAAKLLVTKHLRKCKGYNIPLKDLKY